MSISSHPLKRRRLDNGGSGLSKPFRSPLKASIITQQGNAGTVDPSSNHPQQNNPRAITNSRFPTDQRTSRPAINAPPTRSSQANRQKTPQEITLQKHHSALLLQLTKLRQSLETAQQALKITSSTTDAKLESLISKWKLASREAAEEVFRGAKDRVNGMGGMGAWRERSRKKPEGWGDDEQDGGVGELSEEQREDREIQRDELEAERRKYGSGKVEVMVEERDDDDDVSDLCITIATWEC
jgi:Swi5-dependent recombination DNA repair protein 1